MPTKYEHKIYLFTVSHYYSNTLFGRNGENSSHMRAFYCRHVFSLFFACSFLTISLTWSGSFEGSVSTDVRLLTWRKDDSTTRRQEQNLNLRKNAEYLKHSLCITKTYSTWSININTVFHLYIQWKLNNTRSLELTPYTSYYLELVVNIKCQNASEGHPILLRYPIYILYERIFKWSRPVTNNFKPKIGKKK